MTAQIEDTELQEQYAKTMASFPPFVQMVEPELRSSLEELGTLQVNITYKCNIACKHCHLRCSMDRIEAMSRQDLEACLDVFQQRGFSTLDITGGAPELHPDFEWFVCEASNRGIPMIVRSNLILHEQEGYKHIPALLAELGVNVVASLPHYRERNMEKQRGAGTFNPVIRGIKRLNDLGYGKGEAGRNAAGQLLKLDLVFNPAGINMPPDQATMEAEYKRRLDADFGLAFDNLFAFTNVPEGRFGQALCRAGKLEAYMGKLISAFNPETVENMMCRLEYSVGPDGYLYDCDFNQAMGIRCASGMRITDLLDPAVPLKRSIVFGNHCYACTAGAGSS